MEANGFTEPVETGVTRQRHHHHAISKRRMHVAKQGIQDGHSGVRLI